MEMQQSILDEFDGLKADLIHKQKGCLLKNHIEINEKPLISRLVND